MFDISNLYKTYDGGTQNVNVLSGVNFKCEEGEFIGIFGASGAGKSTLLHILGGLDFPTKGEVKFDGEDIYKKNKRFLAAFRNKTVGFVFQFYHLLPEFSAVENVMLPCLIAGQKRKEAFANAKEALQFVNLEDRDKHKPSELSGGEQQRVAIARAIVMRPKFVLADEPTGNLDESTGEKIFLNLEKLHEAAKTGIIMVTHNPDLLRKIPRRLELKGGLLHEAK
ncbi:MAG: ABC transporter ATP-binding protein [Deltaproteobacteria bacterium]|nr:ABC transporter ATP-binding protein [Deltaproteobacteria bacterium]